MDNRSGLFESTIKTKMNQTIIYNRVSTIEQNPENQLKDCGAEN
jgi:hypothetical protein